MGGCMSVFGGRGRATQLYGEGMGIYSNFSTGELKLPYEQEMDYSQILCKTQAEH